MRGEVGSSASVRDQWSVVATFGDKVLAEAALGLLEDQKLPARITSDGFVPGLGSEFKVLVPEQLLERAQSILERPDVSEQELADLATVSRTIQQRSRSSTASILAICHTLNLAARRRTGVSMPGPFDSTRDVIIRAADFDSAATFYRVRPWADCLVPGCRPRGVRYRGLYAICGGRSAARPGFRVAGFRSRRGESPIVGQWVPHR